MDLLRNMKNYISKERSCFPPDAASYLRKKIPLISAKLLYYYLSTSSLKLSGFVLLMWILTKD